MSERSNFTKEPHASKPACRPVPKYKVFDGKRYELASQDLYDKAYALEVSKSLSAGGYYKTKVIRIQGAWRVYAHRVGFKKKEKKGMGFQCPHCSFHAPRRAAVFSHIRSRHAGS